MSEAAIKLSKQLPKIAAALDETIERVCGESIAFTLIIYTEGRASYISSCAREDSVREMRHLLDLWDQGMTDTPVHKIN